MTSYLTRPPEGSETVLKIADMLIAPRYIATVLDKTIVGESKYL